MDHKPLVSVIMPAYNAESYIGAAIQSILGQTFSDFELIIINDCSTDSTEMIIEQYKDRRIISKKNDRNRGISYTTNRGIQSSRGKYIALMDDDDISLPNRLLLQVNYMEQHNELDILGTGGANIDIDGNIVSYLGAPKYNPNLFKAILLFRSVGFLNGSAMIRKEFMINNELYYKEECLGMQDFMFYMEASKVGKISSIKDVLYYHRNHGKNASDAVLGKYREKRAEKYLSIQRESLAKSGFVLDQRDIDILGEMLAEERASIYTLCQIEKLYLFFQRIIEQSAKMEIGYYNELKYWCKRLLCDRMMRTELFDIRDNIGRNGFEKCIRN